MYFRRQRDRYAIEYTLTDDIAANRTLGQFGMNLKLRLQWQLVSTQGA
jgi:hypothetical protein